MAHLRLFFQHSFVAVHVQTQQDGVEDDHPGHEQSKGPAIQLGSMQIQRKAKSNVEDVPTETTQARTRSSKNSK